MDRKRSLSVATVIIPALLLSILSPVAWSAKTPKTKSAAGREGSGINTILSGRGTPKAAIGVDGDFYIDVSAYTIHGPKKNGKWPTGVNLKGPQGVDGKVGEKGSAGSTGSGSKGDKGDKGDKGEKGERGERGSSGPVGEAGAQGPAGASGGIGATGAQGPAGPSGPAGAQGAAGPAGAEGPAGATGLQGAQGERGEKGDTGDAGPAGATGAKGDTGATGAIGPSSVTVAYVDSFQVSTARNTGHQSSTFGNFEMGKNYQFEVWLQGVVSSTLGHGKFYGLSLASDPAGLVIPYSYSVVESIVFDDGQEKYVYYFRIIGAIASPSSTSSLRVTISHVDGSENMSVSGKAYIREVATVS